MVTIPGGTFSMGSTDGYPEEWPVRTATVAPFAIDRGPVTNAQFREFVERTGHVTVAERRPDQRLYPGAVAGSLVFRRTTGPVDLRDARRWWTYVPGACWHRPRGSGSDLDGLDDHPVVHVALADAVAYARWAGAALPTEAQWERAARGRREGTPYPWGHELEPEDQHMANVWQGRFPFENTAADGYEGTSPVGAFPANDFGLLDAIGNVWEWTADRFNAAAKPARPCCSGGTDDPLAAHVIKGGSFLCAPSYCRRYRPAARIPQTAETSTSHIGFRCAATRETR